MKPYKEEWNKKEFLRAMQAKGKLPRFETEASERYEKVYHETTTRVFPPGKGGIQAVLMSMIDDSEKRINEAQKGLPAGVPPQVVAQSQQVAQSKVAHRELKARLKSVGAQVEAERTARLRAEEDLLSLRIETERRALSQLEEGISTVKAHLVATGRLVP